jgi:hypothetical protein
MHVKQLELGHTARGAADAVVTNEYSKENLTGKRIVVLAVMEDDGELSLTSGPFSYTVRTNTFTEAGRSLLVSCT